MSTALPPSREVDFSIRREDWSRYLVDDGTELRIRIVVRKIIESLLQNPTGYPDFGLESMNVVSAIVPDKLKRQPSTSPFNPTANKGEEIGFKLLSQSIQEYLTTDGFLICVKPVLVKVWKHDSYNIFGEPIYTVNIQQIVEPNKTNQGK